LNKISRRENPIKSSRWLYTAPTSIAEGDIYRRLLSTATFETSIWDKEQTMICICHDDFIIIDVRNYRKLLF